MNVNAPCVLDSLESQAVTLVRIRPLRIHSHVRGVFLTCFYGSCLSVEGSAKGGTVSVFSLSLEGLVHFVAFSSLGYLAAPALI